jgi:hypothetical protein
LAVLCALCELCGAHFILPDTDVRDRHRLWPCSIKEKTQPCQESEEPRGPAHPHTGTVRGHRETRVLTEQSG